MKTYHIYYNGHYLNTVYAYNSCEAIAYFSTMHHSYKHVMLSAMEVYVP